MPQDITFESMRDLEAITSVTITTDAASVDVVPTDDGDDVTSIALVERDGTPRPDLLTVVQVRDEARVSVRSVRDGRWRRNRSIDVRLLVRTPRSVAVDIDSDAGAIRVEGRDAAVSVTAAAGLVFLRDVHGAMRVTSSAGKVTLTETEGDAVVTGLAGAVRLDQHRGSTLSLTASAGGVKGDGLVVDHVDATTEAGAILLRFDEPPKTVDASCTVGAITLALPDADYDIDQQSGALSRARLNGIESVPGADRKIRVASTVGSVTVALAEGVTA